MTKPTAEVTPSAFTKKEADRLMKRIDTFYNKLAEDYGADRCESFMSTIQAVVHVDGILTNVRGNVNTSQFSIATALNLLIDSVSTNLSLNKESVLLYCITDLAQQVRDLWKQPLPPPLPSNAKPTKAKRTKGKTK